MGGITVQQFAFYDDINIDVLHLIFEKLDFCNLSNLMQTNYSMRHQVRQHVHRILCGLFSHMELDLLQVFPVLEQSGRVIFSSIVPLVLNHASFAPHNLDIIISADYAENAVQHLKSIYPLDVHSMPEWRSLRLLPNVKNVLILSGA